MARLPVSPISAYINCYEGPASNAMQFTFLAGCNVTAGAYQFELRATDKYTGGVTTSKGIYTFVL